MGTRRADAAAPVLVLSEREHLDPGAIPRMRTHGAAGGAIRVAVDGLPVPSAMRASIAMTSAARDCGCELGSRCAAATLLASLAVRWARTASVLPHGVAPIAGTVGATFAAALVGKALGILRARSRLRRLLRACSNEASAAPAIASGV